MLIYTTNTMKKDNIIIFDMDETLGYFKQLSNIVYALEKNNYDIKNQDIFNELLDLYPEYIRPKIYDILLYILDKRRNKDCSKILIYTNNNGPRVWLESISNYFNYKLKTKVFDKIIGAFKINGEVVELCRSSNKKKYDDIMQCTLINEKTQICFIDDQIHNQMENENVYYIQIKPYIYNIKVDDILNRYYNKFKPTDSKSIFFKKMKKYINEESYNINYNKEFIIDEVIGKKILMHIKEFFKINK